MRAAIYARVSSAEQRDRRTVDSQVTKLTEGLAADGHEIVGVYIDDGISGTSGHLAERDDLARILADAKAGAMDVVAVVDMDRLSRSEDMIERASIIGTLQRAGVKLWLPGVGLVDLQTFTGDIFVAMHSAVAAQWVRQHKEKIGRGKARAISLGKKPAGPTPYGYGYDRHAPDGARAWSVDADQAAIVAEIFARIAAGASCPAVAADLDRRLVPRPRGGAWSRERVYQIATSRTYLGLWTADKAGAITVPVPRLVSDELWAAVDSQLQRHHRRGVRRTKSVYLLEDGARCELCGAPIGIASAIARPGDRADVPARYLCAYRRRPPAGRAPCTLPYFRASVVDEALWDATADLLQRPDLVEVILQRRRDRAETDGGLWRTDAAQARAHLARLERAERMALAQHRAGRLSEGALTSELADLTRSRAAAQLQLDTALRAGASATDIAAQAQGLETALAQLRDRLDSLDAAGRQQIVRELLGADAVTIGPQVITARFGLASEGACGGGVAGAGGRGAVGHGRRGSTSSVSWEQPLGVVRLAASAALARAVWTGPRLAPTPPEQLAAVVARAAVPPPPYLTPTRLVGGAPRSRDRRPLDLRVCAGCALTFWALTHGTNPARHCSHACYSASGARGARRRAS